MVIPNVVSLIFDIPTGELSDKIGRKNLIILGAAMNVLLGFLLRYVSSIPELVFYMITFGFATLLITPSGRALAMEVSPRNRTGTFFGLVEGMIDLGFMISPLFAGYLLSTYVTDGTFYIGAFAALMCMASMLVFLLTRETVKHISKIFESIHKVITVDGIYRKGLIDFSQLRGVGIVFLVSTFIFVSVDGIIWSIEPLFTTIGFSAIIVGIIMTVYQAASLAEIPAGWLADKFGKIEMLVVGMLLSAIFFALFGLVSNIPDVTAITLNYLNLPIIGSQIIVLSWRALLCILFMLIASAGLGAATPAIEGLLTDKAVKKQHGAVTGVWGSVEDLTYIVSPILAGVVGQIFNLGMSFVFLGIMCALMLPIMKKLLVDHPA
jgi:MFS family permease